MLPMQPNQHLRPGPPFMVPQTLQRGSACLVCRRRKLKCDASKPECTQCLRAGKMCSYDDGKTRTRTQKLQDRIGELESELRRFQNGGTGTPSTSSTSPQEPPRLPMREPMAGHHRPPNDPSSSQSPLVPPPNADLHAQHISLYAQTNLHQSHTSPSALVQQWPSSLLAHEEDVGSTWEDEFLPQAVREHLLENFLLNRHLVYFELDVERFRARLPAANHQRPHPALLQAMCLLGSHFTNDPQYTQHARRLLYRTRQGMLSSITQSDRLLDAIQTAHLISSYLLLKGQLLEAYYESSAAAHLVIACGLHAMNPGAPKGSLSALHSGVVRSGSTLFSKSGLPVGVLEAPKDNGEVQDRILTWWNIFLLDKVQSITTGLPSALPNETDPLHSPSTVWPKSISERQKAPLSSYDASSVDDLFSPSNHASSFAQLDTIHTLRLKAQALLDRATRASQLFDTPYAKTESFQTAFHETDEGIERFIARSVPPVNNLGERGDIVPVQPDATVNPSIFAVLVVAHGAMIQLHTLNASADAVSYDKCLSAARLCVDMLIQVSPSRTLPVDMMLGHCWILVTQVLIRQAEWLRRSHKATEASDIDADVNRVLSAMQQLITSYPSLEFQMKKIQDIRAQPSDITV